MIDATLIEKHMPVIGSDGKHVGTVDKIEGSRMKLTRTDPQADGIHHYLHLDMVDAVDATGVRLGRTAQQTMDEWAVEHAGEPGTG